MASASGNEPKSKGLVCLIVIGMAVRLALNLSGVTFSYKNPFLKGFIYFFEARSKFITLTYDYSNYEFLYFI